MAPLSGTEEPRLTVPPAGESSFGFQFVYEAIPYEPLPHRDEVSQNELETSQTEMSREDGNSFSGPGSRLSTSNQLKIILNNPCLYGDQPELKNHSKDSCIINNFWAG